MNREGAGVVFTFDRAAVPKRGRGSTMKLRIITGIAVAALAVALAGCTSLASEEPAEDTSTATEAPDTGSETEALLTTADTDLGEIVVDGEGMTVYMFDSDTQGGDASTCEGQCATNWAGRNDRCRAHGRRHRGRTRHDRGRRGRDPGDAGRLAALLFRRRQRRG
jgi:predicted lipoprotein with Yx(FWY)xxD motif